MTDRVEIVVSTVGGGPRVVVRLPSDLAALSPEQRDTAVHDAMFRAYEAVIAHLDAERVESAPVSVRRVRIA